MKQCCTKDLIGVQNHDFVLQCLTSAYQRAYDFPALAKNECREFHPADEYTAKRGMRYFFACRFCNDGLAWAAFEQTALVFSAVVESCVSPSPNSTGGGT